MKRRPELMLSKDYVLNIVMEKNYSLRKKLGWGVLYSMGSKLFQILFPIQGGVHSHWNCLIRSPILMYMVKLGWVWA